MTLEECVGLVLSVLLTLYLLYALLRAEHF